MGTPEFSVPSLKLLNKEFGVDLVVTLPDKQKGRGQKFQPTDVKKAAMELNLPILQPESLKSDDFINQLREFEPDIMVVIAFKFLTPSVFTIPKLGCFNVHASLLPKYRGAAPINWAIINGDKTTGLTTFLLQEKIDTGNILLQKEFKIPDGFTAGDLYEFLMPEAAQMAVDTTRLLISGDYKPYPQDNSMATSAPKIFPEFCKINWMQFALDIRNFIHGVSPIPGAWTIMNGQRFKILRVDYCSCGTGLPGKYIIDEDDMVVFCKKGVLSLVEVQPQGKRVMKISEFLNGYRGNSEGFFE